MYSSFNKNCCHKSKALLDSASCLSLFFPDRLMQHPDVSNYSVMENLSLGWGAGRVPFSF